MIGRLTGKVAQCSPGRVLLDVAGVGYDVQIPLSTFYALSTTAAQTASLHVHTHVREDALQLFGFATAEERWGFELLIGITGVGPRLALAILSGIGVHELRVAVLEQDCARLQRIPGVGKKTAERLLLELKDRLRPDKGGPHAGPSSASPLAGPGPDLRADAVSALVNLGYSPDVAARAVAAADREQGPGANLESLLRAALGGLVR